MKRRIFLQNLAIGALGAHALPALAAKTAIKKAMAAEDGFSQAQLRAAKIEPFAEFGKFSLLYSMRGTNGFLLTQISSAGKVVRSLEFQIPSLHAHVLSPDKKSLVILSNSHDRGVVVDLPAFRVRATLHAQPGHNFPGHAVFSLDGQTLYVPETSTSEAEPGFVGVRSFSSLALKSRYETGAYKPHAVLLSADGQRLIVGHYGHLSEKITTNGGVSVLEAKTGKIIKQPTYPGANTVACHLEPGDGDQVFVSTRAWREGESGSEHLPSPILFGSEGAAAWEAHWPPALADRCRFNFSLRYSAAHQVLAVNHQAGNMITFWHGKQKSFLSMAECDGEKPLSLELTPDGHHFLVTTLNGSLFIFRAKDGALARRMRLPHIGWTPHLAVLPSS